MIKFINKYINFPNSVKIFLSEEWYNYVIVKYYQLGCDDVNRKKITSLGFAVLILFTILALTFLANHVKAARFDIQINWYKAYLTDSYDGDDSGCFMVQIKYYDNGWDMKKSSKFWCTVLEPGYFWPGKSFTITDVTAITTFISEW